MGDLLRQPALSALHSRQPGLQGLDPWEAAFAPYDEATYAAALAALPPGGRVLDIGAGDLRFAARAAAAGAQVWAIEARPELLPPILPPGVHLLLGDARRLPFPAVDVGVLLMRHCRHVGLYGRKLKAAGATRLVTNARFGLAVEVIDLNAPRRPWRELTLGPWACVCGAVGCRDGDPARLPPAAWETPCEVYDCPTCCAAAGLEKGA